MRRKKSLSLLPSPKMNSKRVFEANLIQDEAESSGFLYLSRNEDSNMLMASGVEGGTGSSEPRNNMLLTDAKMIVISPEKQQLPPSRPLTSIENCTLNCESSDDGNENVEYCEEDEANLNPEDHNLTMEERHS
eukprot:CAMPEP_0185575636 /NCGR_PEP_ID=MMETSP0434-20130131/6772_1 /TAXON_ID=626734 ORGANISM="Favella taraikaensis, Strain Fe Narragansett Bay" /NCGR_SAMPLE_ID=MMETSP0434 /ASSEMBLY_ACC=CAM_ASM_000379 /LENGTH=132 /DNA_ID=CAMNT_0028192571 /DNA_START=141 /DNA_END=538 /DNA_ORIENTATION=+